MIEPEIWDIQDKAPVRIPCTEQELLTFTVSERARYERAAATARLIDAIQQMGDYSGI